MRVSCLVLLACLAGSASAKQVTLSPPSVTQSPPPPSPPAATPAATFLTPGVVFSIVVPGATSLSAGSQAAFISQITTAFQGPKFTSSATIAGVTAFNGTAAIVNGFVSAVWSATPTVTDLQLATSLRDSLITTLTTNTTSVLTGFPGATANSECLGTAVVSALSTDPLVFSVNVTAPGPLQCGARLSYSPSDAITNQVGIDDGSVVAGNRGKYCSSPAVVGGVVGIPGSGPCRQYGVIANEAGTASATAGTVTISGGSITSIATGTGGTGYTSAPTVTISAPTQIPAQVTITVSSAGAGTPTLTPTDNGPYAGATLRASSLGGGPCVASTCSGASQTIVGLATVTTGPTCTVSDWNSANVITVATSTGAATVTGMPTGWTCTPSAPPTIVLATNTLQSGIRATAVASISDGAITTITVVTPGSGYVTGTANKPTVTISAPSAGNVGKLCSLNPISLDPAIAVNTAITAGVTTTGQCQPIGRNTIKNVPCSIPAAPSGLYAPINVGTCNVVSTFIPQPGSTVTSVYGVVPQSFTTTVAGGAPAPTPTPAPAPAPTAPPTASYRGRFQIGSVACKGKFLAASASCADRSVLLRTVSQSKGSRTVWAIDGTAGVATGVTSVVRIGSCNGRANLASAQSTPTPVIGGPSWKVKLTPVDASKPNVVTIEATDKTYKGKFLQVGDKCDDQRGFVWAAKSSSTGQQWELTTLANVN